MKKYCLAFCLIMITVFCLMAGQGISLVEAAELQDEGSEQSSAKYDLSGKVNGFQMPVPTAHNGAKYGEIAKTVLMPGDPLRSKYVAENFLTDPVLVNDVRGVQGYTGTWKGVPVTIMSSGMGIPSIGIYSWELYNGYGVENIIRIGTAGGLQDNVHVRDIIIAQGACTDSNFVHQFNLNGTYAPIADFDLLRSAVKVIESKGIKPHIGNVISTDNFYSDGNDSYDQWKKMGVLAVEMECAGLYMNAARLGKRALTICTVSDHVYNGSDELSAKERETLLHQMIEIALDIAVAIR